MASGLRRADAVFQFFLNGGSNCYVVALQAGNYFDPTKVPPANDTGKAVVAATGLIGTSANGFTFTALQPVGLASPALGLTMTAHGQQPDQDHGGTRTRPT